MTVEDVVFRLNQLPQDLEVFVDATDEPTSNFPVSEVFVGELDGQTQAVFIG